MLVAEMLKITSNEALSRDNWGRGRTFGIKMVTPQIAIQVTPLLLVVTM